MSEPKEKPTKFKVSLIAPLKDAKGRPMMNPKTDELGDPVLIEVRKDGRAIYEREPVTVKDIAIAVLTNPTPAEAKDKGLKGRKALKMSNLAAHLLTKETYPFSVSQVSVICKRVEVMYAAQPRVLTEMWGAFGYSTTDEMDFEGEE